MSSLYYLGEWLKKHLPNRLSAMCLSDKESKLLNYGQPRFQVENMKRYEYEKIGLAFSLLIIWLILLIYSFIAYEKEQAIANVIEKPPYGTRQQEVKLRYSWEDEEVYSYSYVLEVLEQLNDKEDTLGYLVSKVEELEAIILGENLSKDSVKEDLRIEATPFEDKNIQVNYVSLNTQVLTHQGRIRYAQYEVPTKVQMEMTLSYGESKYQHVVELQLLPRALSKRDYYKELETKIRENDSVVTLPVLHENGQWYRLESGLKPMSAFVMGGLMIYGFIILKYYEAKKMKNDYQEELLEDLPRFIQSLSLLMHAGATLQQAWHRIGIDYQRRRAGCVKRKLYEEIIYLQSAYEKGVSFSQGLTDLDRHCQILELSRLVSMLQQNIKKGNEFLIQGLDALGREAWHMRIDQIKKKGERISTQLLLPMMLQLLIILVMVLAPAFISMSI